MRYLGLDLGKKTCGVSLSDKTGVVASFYKSIRYEDEEKLLKELKEIIDKEGAEKIVLGLPKNMNNSLGFRAEETLDFKEKLQSITKKEIFLEDERLTTVVAEHTLISADLSRKKRKKVIDGVSAVIILQSFLDRKEK